MRRLKNIAWHRRSGKRENGTPVSEWLIARLRILGFILSKHKRVEWCLKLFDSSGRTSPPRPLVPRLFVHTVYKYLSIPHRDGWWNTTHREKEKVNWIHYIMIVQCGVGSFSLVAG